MNDPFPSAAERIALARERRNAGDYRAAMQHLDAATAADPQSAEAFSERGCTQLEAAAIGWSVFLSSAELTGLFAEYDAPIEALSCKRCQAFLGALDDFASAIAIDPACATAWLGRARLRRAMFHSGAWEDYNRAAVLLPADSVLRVELSGHRLNAGNRADALKAAEAALALAPQDADAWAARGRVKLAKQDIKGSRADFDRGLELDPSHVPSMLGRARSRAWDEPSGAREDHARAAAMTPSKPADHYFRGLAHDTASRQEEARQDYSRALEATPVWSPHRKDLEHRLKKVVTPPLLRRIAGAPVTVALLGLCVALVTLAESQGSTTNVDILLRFGATERGHVWSGEYWRLLSSMFLHVGWIHLGWNVWGMFGWCERVERSLGHGRFLFAYLLCGIAASATSLVGHHFVAVGASGAAFGIIGILLSGAFFRLGGWSAFLFNRAVFQILKWVGIWFLLGVTVMPMDNWAHFGGLVAGLAIGGFWATPRPLSTAARRIGWSVFAAAFLALLAAACFPWPFVYPEMRGWSSFNQAVLLLEKKNAAAAEAEFNRAHELGYRSEYLFHNRGLAKQQQNKLQEALEDFNEAIRLNPHWPVAYYGRGVCREANGQNDEAMRDFELGLKEFPNDPDLLTGRARRILAKGDIEGAVKDYREALKHAPADWYQRANLEQWLKGQGR